MLECLSPSHQPNSRNSAACESSQPRLHSGCFNHRAESPRVPAGSYGPSRKVGPPQHQSGRTAACGGAPILCIYIAIQSRCVASGIEFDWDSANRKHLGAHCVTPAEFEQLILNDPVDVDYDIINGEQRYRSVGITLQGRLLSAVWTIRNGKIRAITAFPASMRDRRHYLERKI